MLSGDCGMWGDRGAVGALLVGCEGGAMAGGSVPSSVTSSMEFGICWVAIGGTWAEKSILWERGIIIIFKVRVLDSSFME